MLIFALSVTAIGLVGIAGYWLFILAEGSYLGAWCVRLIYQLGARHYDRIHAPARVGDQSWLAPLLMQLVADHPHPALLDVATGTGRVPLLLAASGWSGSLAGLDLSPAMLAIAEQKRSVQLPTAAIDWRVGRAEALPWPQNRFDLVTCLEALEYCARPRRALAEMSRVLRPGGILVVSKMPDRWARLLPGRGLTQSAMRRALVGLGLEQIAFHPWQPGYYELVIARKPVGATPS